MPAVTGDAFQRVNLDTTQRLGLLTQGGIMAGLTHSNHTNPVTRGGFIVNVLMCRGIELPAGANVSPVPDSYSAPTTRERYTLHSANDECAGCHVQMDPTRLRARKLRRHRALPSDGKWRPHRRELARCRTCRAATSATAPPALLARGKRAAPSTRRRATARAQPELLQAPRPETAKSWPAFRRDGSTTPTGSRSRVANPQDVCNREALYASFVQSGFNVKQLLVALTQTDGFLYLGSPE